MELLKIDNLSKEYKGGTKALSNISFSINKGEFISIIGPSGAGKSTLLRCINKMIDSTEGKIIFDDVEVNNVNKKELRTLRTKIGMIFQHYNLVERLSVIENVLHGRLGYKSTLQGVIGIYTEEEKKNAFKVLSMDPNASKIIMDHLKTINKDLGITCLLNLHQVDVAMKYSDRIIGINGGKTIFNGKPSELTKEKIHEIYGSDEGSLITD